MSYYDTRRDSVPAPDMTTVDVRQPGTSSSPATQYQPVKSAGPRVLPARVRAQRQIDANSGEALDARMAAMLDSVVEGLRDRDVHMVRREMAHGVAVGSHLRAADRFSGYLGEGSDCRLRGPHDQLRWIFGVAR
jgi:hypothetical protein